MKKIFICLFFIALGAGLRAQSINADSLINVAVARESKSKNVPPPNRDSLLRVLPYAKSSKERVAIIYKIIIDFVSGQTTYCNKIIEISKKAHDVVSEAIGTGELANTLYENGDKAEGLKMAYRSLALAEKSGNKQALGFAYMQLGYIYPEYNNLKKAYLKKALIFSGAAHDDIEFFFEYSYLGTYYSQIHKTDSAKYIFKKAIKFSVEKNIYNGFEYFIVAFANSQPELKQQLKYYEIALRLAEAKNDPSSISQIMSYLAIYYMRKNRPDSALYYAESAYKNSTRSALSVRLNPARILARLYNGSNPDSALKYTEIYYQTKDSLFSVGKAAREQSLIYERQRQDEEIEREKETYRIQFKLYLLLAVAVFLLLLATNFWRTTKKEKKTNLLLYEQKERIQQTLKDLKQTQSQLIQAEKMASLGELTAGIAHEIQNPLNFVNNFAEVSVELLSELKDEADAGNKQDVLAIADDLAQNLEKISFHGKRADGIVKGMLQHSRASSGQKEPTNINVFADEYLRLAYHGLRAKDKTFNTDLITHFDDKLPLVNIVPQDIGRVLLNLFTNAFYAVQQKAKTAGPDYKPTVEVNTATENNELVISVKDNGIGIPEHIKDKIMQPFFTTKPTGEGTGLGLSLSYDIVVKAHGGKIGVESEEGKRTIFTVTIPV